MCEPTKRYFHVHATTNTHIDYPPEFVNSRNPKLVWVLGAYLFIEDEADKNKFERPSYCELHASFVQVDDWYNQYVCLVNTPLYQRRKFEQFGDTKGFDWWLTDFTGAKMTMSDKTYLVIELMLEF